MSARAAVLLVGSARPSGTSTSEALGRSLLRRLVAAGFAGRVFLVAHWRSDEALRELRDAVAAAEIFVLAAPLYEDSLPYLVVRAFEAIAADRTRPGAPPAPARFLAMVNCGFPEAAQTQTALDICRIFAAQAGFEPASALGLGGGETLHGRPPEALGWLARHVRRALDLTAQALLAGRPVPQKAVELMARPIVPAIGYLLVANHNWRREARRWGAESKLAARPYEPAAPGAAAS